MYGVATFMQFLSFALIFFLAAVYISNNDLGIDGPLCAIFLIIFAGITAGNNANFMPDISNAKTATKRLFDILDLEDEYQIRERMGSKQIKEPIKGNIKFVDVSFKYENRDSLVLDKFNLDIKEGENVGLVGVSGCGKSTVFSLLLGFYAPTGGQILIEGIEIQDYDLHHLRKSFGVVSQEPMLFNETIEWNIRYNLIDASDEEIFNAANQAHFNPNNVQGQQSPIEEFKQ
jgi:ATP-binding cassette, subfamily B (MDR/TAP), member 1